MFGARSGLIRYTKRFLIANNTRTFCNNSTSPINKPLKTTINGGGKNAEINDIRNLEAYRDLDKLNYFKDAKIIFSNPTNKKKFGLDFRLVKLFSSFMPPLAACLVATYALYEIKRMEEEAELKKKTEEEEKTKQIEADVNEPVSDSGVLKAKESLETLQEAVKD